MSTATDQRVLSCLCLLLSHVVWNHPNNQRLFGREAALRKLLGFLSPHGRPPAAGCGWGDTGAAAEEEKEAGEGDGASIELTMTALMARALTVGWSAQNKAPCVKLNAPESRLHAQSD